jgi:hypothetical protein
LLSGIWKAGLAPNKKSKLFSFLQFFETHIIQRECLNIDIFSWIVAANDFPAPWPALHQCELTRVDHFPFVFHLQQI